MPFRLIRSQIDERSTMKTLFPVIALALSAIWAVPEPDAIGVAGTPECELANEWVEAHRDALPTTLGAFSEHSMIYRRAIYQALDVEDRISLWQEHIATVADQVTLPQQRLFLERAMPELGRYLSVTPSESGLDAFAEEATKVLGEDLARDAFGVLGTAPEPTLEEGDAQLPDCSCLVGSEEWNCRAGSDCRGRKWIIFDVCEDIGSGCGPLWLFECNGLCYRQDPR